MKSVHGSIKLTLLALFIITLSFDLSGQDNKGNPIPHFLFPSFREGNVVMKDGKNFNASLNYNMVEEKMITEVNGIYRYPKNIRLIDTIYLENRVFIPVGNKFYEVLSTGLVTFFLQNKSSFAPKGSEVGYGVTSRSVGPTKLQRFELSDVMYQSGEVVYIDLPPDVDITHASVYWVNKDDNMEEFSTKKQFLLLFPEFRTELDEYIKKENINIKSREDVIRLGNYYNEIIKKK
ncbi:MAG: hypothetical protein V1903_05365 [Bacteroidota bacterium]